MATARSLTLPVYGSGGAPDISAVAETDIHPGFPVAINRANGKAVIANAATYARSSVIGVPDFLTGAGFVCVVKQGKVTLADWTASAGSASLLVGQTYFLGESGGLVTIPPSATGLALVVVGEAVDPQTLFVNPSQPILL